MLDDLDAVLSSLGPRLRTLRKHRNITLGALARSTGISVSTLSRLESGARKPSLELLLPVARAHEISLDELIGTARAPETKPRPGHNDPRRSSIVIPLSTRPGGLRTSKEIHLPSPLDQQPDPKVHPGYMWLYVIDGSLRLILGSNDVVMRPGETVEFDTRMPHWFSPAEPRPVETLSVYGPQGERMRAWTR